MRRTKKNNGIALYLTLLHIVSINSQPLETSKISLKVNNEKKEVSTIKFTAANAIPNASLNVPAQVGTSTHPPLFHNIEAAKDETSTRNIEVSTFPPLIRDSNHKIYFPDSIMPKFSLENTYLSQSSTFPPPTRNPNLGIVRHPSKKVVTSTHPPLIHTMVHTSKPVEDSSSVSIEDRFLSESSTYPPPTRNPNLGISRHPPNKVVTSTHPPLVHHMDPPLKPEKNSSIVSIEDRFQSESSTYPPPTRNPSLGISRHPPNKIVTSTHPPLIHNMNHTFKPIEANSTVSIEDRFLFENSTDPPLTKNPNLGVSTQPSNEIVSSTFPPLIHMDHTLNPVEDSSTVSIEDRFLSENSTYPPPTRNPNLGISTHPPNKMTTSQVLEMQPGRGEHVISDGQETILVVSTTNSPLIPNLETAHLPLSSEIESTKRIETITTTAPTTRSTAANVVSITTYPPPTRNPNLGISIHHPDKINSSASSMLNLEVNGTLITDSGDPSKVIERFDIKKCSFAIVGCCSMISASHVNCFELLGCPGPFLGKNLCEKDIIGNAIELVKAYYETGM